MLLVIEIGVERLAYFIPLLFLQCPKFYPFTTFPPLSALFPRVTIPLGMIWWFPISHAVWKLPLPDPFISSLSLFPRLVTIDLRTIIHFLMLHVVLSFIWSWLCVFPLISPNHSLLFSCSLSSLPSPAFHIHRCSAAVEALLEFGVYFSTNK